jgi:hypothetical protein
MNDKEYEIWLLKDSTNSLLQALVIYATLLGAYWLLVG